MSTDLDTSRIVRSWLRTDEHESAERVLAAVVDALDTTPQRRPWWPARRFREMNSYAKLAVAAVAVVALAFVGLNLLPSGGGPSVGGPPASPTPSPAPTESATPSSGAVPWPVGILENRPYHLTTSTGVPISFTPPTTWRSRGEDILETGLFPTDSYAWIVFGGDIGEVATDPCHGQSTPVEGSSIDDLAAALATIPGLTAEEPVDATIDGQPGKLVTLTVDPDPPCAMNEYWLYGNISLYPNSVDSILRLWITEVDGERYAIHTDQAGDNPQVEREIQQIIDSIQFE